MLGTNIRRLAPYIQVLRYLNLRYLVVVGNLWGRLRAPCNGSRTLGLSVQNNYLPYTIPPMQVKIRLGCLFRCIAKLSIEFPTTKLMERPYVCPLLAPSMFQIKISV